VGGPIGEERVGGDDGEERVVLHASPFTPLLLLWRMAAQRVAFVLSGQSRSFTDAVTRNSIRQNAIDALCPSPAECAPVLFLCAELGEWWSRGRRARSPTA
jgi:hypothetical protein